MKKVITILVVIFMASHAMAQITLDHSFNYSATVTKINTDTYKYYLMDVPGEQCKIYNNDFSLYKTISTPVPEGEWLYDVRFVSEDLFNEDNLIELLYTYYKWIVTNQNTGEGYYEYHSKIINEASTVILDAPGVLYSYVKETAPEEYKLFLYAYDNSVTPTTIQTRIYSLPGEPYSTEYIKKNSFQLEDPYPNPSEKTVNIKYNLPPAVDFANLVIINDRGGIHSQYTIDGFTDHIILNTNIFTPGIYFYYLANGNEKSEVKKLIIP